jgi:hypothetical protein
MDVLSLKAGMKLAYIGKTTGELTEGCLVTVREVQVDLEPDNSQVYVCRGTKKCMQPVQPAKLVQYTT